jgi:hypothetical protein
MSGLRYTRDAVELQDLPMSNTLNVPTAQIKCPNPKCGKERPAADRYCAACGSALQADVRELVRWALEEQTKDREVFQIETAKAIAERIWDWGKLFLGIAGVSTALFVLALAVVGYKSIADIDRSREDTDKMAQEAKNSIKEMKADIQVSLADFESKRKVVIAEFEKGKTQLEEVGKKLPALIDRIDGVAARLDEAEPQLAQLDKKVGELEDQFVGRLLAPTMSDRLRQKLAPFRQYLGALGLNGSGDDIPFFHGGPQADDNIAYLPTDPKIIIGSAFLQNKQFLDAPDSVAREFAHHVLFKSLENAGTSERPFLTQWTISLESGLADYFVASWLNNPSPYQAIKVVLTERGLLNSDKFRELKNDRSLKDLPELPEFETVIASEIWGGLFWELREQLGQPVADKLLADLWKSIRPQEINENPLTTASLIRGKLLELAEPIDNGKHIDSIRMVFQNRGLRP